MTTATIPPKVNIPAKREFKLIVRPGGPDELASAIADEVQPLGFRQVYVTSQKWQPIRIEKNDGTLIPVGWVVEVEGWGQE